MEFLRDFLLVVGGAFLKDLGQALIVRLSKTKAEREGENKKLDAQTELDISKSAQAIADGSTVAVTNLLRSVEYMKQELVDAKDKRLKREEEILAERAAFNNEIAALHRSIEDGFLETKVLKKTIDDLNAKQAVDIQETQKLRNDYAIAQAQIIKQQEQITHHEGLIVGLGEYVDAQNKAMEGANIKVEVNGKFKKLLESVYRLRLERKQ